MPIYQNISNKSFDYFLGGLQAIAELLQVDCEMYGLTNDHYSVTLRRYAGMALTNLTFGDVANKVGSNLFGFISIYCNRCFYTSQIDSCYLKSCCKF